MPFVKAQPNEYLVTGHKGRVVNRGAAASVFLWPGTSYVLIPGTQQEAAFEMTQESSDGIPLRFKGTVIYRVVRPEEAARLFDFSSGQAGHDQIKTLLGHICLGELRAQVAHLTMQQCIEQRKTTLTDAVAAALRLAIQGRAQEGGWGIELHVVQVAQVFIVDKDMRRQLEAEVRNQIRSGSELSDLRMAEELRQARTVSERKLLQEGLETEKERARVDKERARIQLEEEQERGRARNQVEKEQLQLERSLEQDRLALEAQRIEEEAPIRQLKLEKENALLQKQLEVLRAQLELRELEVRRSMLEERARHELRKEMLPLEQLPQVAEAAASLFQGANLTFYGEASPLMSALNPTLGLLTQTLKSVAPKASPNGAGR